ncbi:MarR family transcriptional regulator [Roseiarcaceae bacterium H3SJ34-1]|uniref:MarR family winged helix-turn-helix transcriptional regulator n=1 Tax=Terripilifer ovatus TaxID=3032367 RepID=UPI003AB99DDA|nr:MarR family transcriptional regulator [Roseiarcaceae bacterium H3SJ34-1]
MKPEPRSRWDMSTFIPYKVSILATHFRQAIAGLYRPALGITEGEWKVLVTVAHYGPLASSDIGAHMTLDRMAVSRALNRLIELGLVRRRPHASDQRISTVSLTASGERSFDILAREAAALERKALQHFSTAEKTELLRLMEKLEAGLSRENS